MAALQDRLITTITITLATVLAVVMAYCVAPSDVLLFLWAGIIAALMPFSNVGETKLKQTCCFVLQGILIALNTVLIILLLTLPYYWAVLCTTILIFIYYSACRFYFFFEKTSLYLAVYVIMIWRFEQLQVFMSLPITTKLTFGLTGIGLGVASAVVINGLLPTVKIIVEAGSKDNYLYIRAFRVAVSIFIAFVIGRYFELYSTAWVCFSIITVSQISLGKTVKKAIDRSLATVLGIVVGILLARYFAILSVHSIYILIIILAIGSYLIQIRYAYGLFFYILLLVGIYALMQPHHLLNITAFTLSRLVDTAIGVAIAICAELIIFPRSYVYNFRFYIFEVLKCIARQLENPSEAHLDALNDALGKLSLYREEVRYEPIKLFLRRYQYCMATVKQLNKLAAACPKLASAHHDILYQKLVALYKRLTQLDFSKPDPEKLDIVQSIKRDIEIILQSDEIKKSHYALFYKDSLDLVLAMEAGYKLPVFRYRFKS